MTAAKENRSVEAQLHVTHLPLEEPYGWKARIGLIVLSTDPVIERDFHCLVPSDEIGVFSTRIPLETPNSDRTFLALADELEPAARLLIPDSRLDAIVFGCTSASTLIGPCRIAELVQRGRPGVACTNPATAALAALRRLNARRIALVTPYTLQMTGNVMRFLIENGIELTSVRAMGLDTDHAIGSIPAEVFVEAAMASDLQRADAIFISCTGTKALNVIERIETATGLPTVVSNQAAFWHALSLTGWSTTIPGYGRLLHDVW
ncbi:aspartate/glutamate racemase family protein [Microvirga sp. VF16]|uniref:maleate cis-trans isomerase family protein n=1 Tax=Microvirga sp. VF16 TaxID=2807101 RepID=UPI00193E7442|nr:aspartate/glutamate racemase family protein [Microvirga sp. VF16]QRM33144.1 Asp/Glu/hydantoin racemase [Microvirga sp. VF16]